MPERFRHTVAAASGVEAFYASMDVSEAVAEWPWMLTRGETSGTTFPKRTVRTARQLPGQAPPSPQEEKATNAHYDDVLCSAAHCCGVIKQDRSGTVPQAVAMTTLPLRCHGEGHRD